MKKQQALAANYPFATIEPNVGIVPVPDARLKKLAEIVARDSSSSTQNDHESSRHGLNNMPPIKPATVEFVDIAGLVKGASEGAGLGNKFLSHIREVKIIAHVVRVFEDADIVKEGSVDPKSDYEVITTELMIADLQTLQKALENRKIEPFKKTTIQKAIDALNNDTPIRNVEFTDEEREAIKDLFLLSGKPEVIVLNVSEQDYTKERIPEIVKDYSSRLRSNDKNFDASNTSAPLSASNFVVICAKIESELSELSEDEQKQYLADLGLKESGLERLIQKSYETLGLISFLTAGEKEVRAWTIKKGTNAQYAAGEIHTDFIKKFIKAEVVSYDEYVAAGGIKKARELGKARQEGRDYVVEDGDVIEFKIGS